MFNLDVNKIDFELSLQIIHDYNVGAIHRHNILGFGTKTL